MSSSSSSSSSLVTAMPDHQSSLTDEELNAIAPKPSLHCNSFLQFPRPGFINEIDAMPSGFWWPWPTPSDAIQDLFPDWIASKEQISASQYRYHYTIPFNTITMTIPLLGAIGAGAGFVLGGKFARHFRLGRNATLLSRAVFSGAVGNAAFGAGATAYAVHRYTSFFREHPNGPVFNPPLSHRQSFQGVSKDGEIIRTPGMPMGLYASPFEVVDYRVQHRQMKPSEAKVYKALLRKMDKEGVEAAKLRNAEHQHQQQNH